MVKLNLLTQYFYIDLTLSKSTSTSESEDERQLNEANDLPKHAFNCMAVTSSMVDRATLNKLTKEDLLIRWRAAEADWARQLGRIKNQRDLLLSHLSHLSKSKKEHRLQLPPPS